jgi:hypothetical protein
VLGPTDWARRCCFPLLAALLLASCSTVSDTFDVGPFMREQITGDTWRSCLAREYQTQARTQLRAGRHWAEATNLAAKGRDALEGADVTPEPPPRSLTADRTRLDTALANRAAKPCDCAKAQARYDGMTEAVARKMDTTPHRAPFEDALTACTSR